jgi:hypothetical protein
MILRLSPRDRHVVSNEQDIPVSNHPLTATNRLRDSNLSRFSSCVCAIASDRHERQPFDLPLSQRRKSLGSIQTT